MRSDTNPGVEDGFKVDVMSEVTFPAEPRFGSSPAETVGETELLGRLTVRVLGPLRMVCSPETFSRLFGP
jgi:hypothetical protein